MKNSPLHRLWLVLVVLVSGVLACNYPGLAPAPTPYAVNPPLPTAPTMAAAPASPFPTATQQFWPSATPTQPAPSPAASPTTPYQPAFEPAPCAFPAPDGYQPECGYLLVPENRSRPDSPWIRLHVAVFRSRSASPAPDPVVHLAGGPGSSSLGVAGYMLSRGLDAVLEQRDLILFDQRGTGYSQPYLGCPERQEVTPLLLGGGLSPAEEEQAILDAFRRCRERLQAEGIDLAAYNSAASAADVNDLRLALGYPQFNLYGVSYGTRLALTVLRDHAGAARSVVLDSTYPPQVNLYTAMAPNAARAFDVLFDRCASDPDCAAAYPDLRGVFFGLVDELNASPVVVVVPDGGIEHSVSVDGGLLVDVLFVGLYNPLSADRMPEMIYSIRNGDFTLLKQRLSLYFDTSPALGMQMAVQCSEEMPFNSPEEAFTMAQGVPPQIAGFFPASVQTLFAACREWNTPLDPVENQPVGSTVPALIFAGEYDPITPPDWGLLAARTFSQAYYYEFPGHGHWVMRSSPCSLQIALAFWENPNEAPDSTCLQSVGGLRFTR